MSILIHTVTIKHTGGTDHTYALSSAPAAHDFAKIVRERGLTAMLSVTFLYSLEDNLASFEAIESALSAAHANHEEIA
jgi:hypothetical protein